MYKIACIMGKSSSGKDHIYKALLKKPGLNLKRIVPYTTRPMRDGEKEGVEYHFTDDTEALLMEREGRIIEQRSYETVYGPWKYFTADDGSIDINENRYLAIGTLEMYISFCRYFGKDNVMPIYIEVEDGIRLMRALKRERSQDNPKYKEMCRRFIADCEDFSEEKLSDAGINIRYSNNGRIKECIEAICNDIREYM